MTTDLNENSWFLEWERSIRPKNGRSGLGRSPDSAVSRLQKKEFTNFRVFEISMVLPAYFREDIPVQGSTL